MKKLLILLFSILISFNSYGEWTKIGSVDNEKTIFYIDYQTIRVVDNYVYWWEMNSSSIPNESGFRSTQILRQGDCQLFRDKPITYVYFIKAMGNGNFDYESTPKNPDWFFPYPGSISQMILNSVCQYIN